MQPRENGTCGHCAARDRPKTPTRVVCSKPSCGWEGTLEVHRHPANPHWGLSNDLDTYAWCPDCEGGVVPA